MEVPPQLKESFFNRSEHLFPNIANIVGLSVAQKRGKAKLYPSAFPFSKPTSGPVWHAAPDVAKKSLPIAPLRFFWAPELPGFPPTKLVVWPSDTPIPAGLLHSSARETWNPVADIQESVLPIQVAALSIGGPLGATVFGATSLLDKFLDFSQIVGEKGIVSGGIEYVSKDYCENLSSKMIQTGLNRLGLSAWSRVTNLVDFGGSTILEEKFWSKIRQKAIEDMMAPCELPLTYHGLPITPELVGDLAAHYAFHLPKAEREVVRQQAVELARKYSKKQVVEKKQNIESVSAQPSSLNGNMAIQAPQRDNVAILGNQNHLYDFGRQLVDPIKVFNGLRPLASIQSALANPQNKLPSWDILFSGLAKLPIKFSSPDQSSSSFDNYRARNYQHLENIFKFEPFNLMPYIEFNRHGGFNCGVSTTDPYTGAMLVAGALIIPKIKWLLASPQQRTVMDIRDCMQSLDRANGDLLRRTFSLDVFRHPYETILAPEELQERRQHELVSAYSEQAAQHPGDKHKDLLAKQVKFVYEHNNGEYRNLLNNLEVNFPEIGKIYSSAMNKDLIAFQNLVKTNNKSAIIEKANELECMLPESRSRWIVLAWKHEVSDNYPQAETCYNQARQATVEKLRHLENNCPDIPLNQSHDSILAEYEQRKNHALQEERSADMDFVYFLSRKAEKVNRNQQKNIGQLKDTVRILKQKYGNDGAILRLGVEACKMSRDYVEAANYQLAICQTSNRPEDDYLLANLYHKAGDPRWANALENYIVKSGNYEDAFSLAGHYADEKKWLKAQKLIEGCNQRNPNNLQLQEAYIECLKQQGKLSEIEQFIGAAVKDPNCHVKLREYWDVIRAEHFKQAENKVIFASLIAVGSFNAGKGLGYKLGEYMAKQGIFGAPGSFFKAHNLTSDMSVSSNEESIRP